MFKLQRNAFLCAGLIAASILTAGCGSGGNKPASGGGSGPQRGISEAIAFARCMRSHGVSGFPDPQITTQGGGVGVSQGVPAQVAQAPAFKSAQAACAKLEPGGQNGNGPGPQTAAEHAQSVKYAACLRAHGVPNFPDPSANGVFRVPSDINLQAPQFNNADRDCSSVRPRSIAMAQAAPGQ
jgi:hypothetical protein